MEFIPPVSLRCTFMDNFFEDTVSSATLRGKLEIPFHCSQASIFDLSCPVSLLRSHLLGCVTAQKTGAKEAQLMVQ